MGSLFHTDGKLYHFLTLLYDLFILNLLWILCSIPIITIGASTTSLYYVMFKRLRKEEGKPVSNFFKSFKQNFKQSTASFAILLLFVVIIYLTLNNQHLIDVPELIIFLQYPILVVLALISIYIFPLIACFEAPIGTHFRNAIVLSIVHFVTTILCGITLFSLVYIMIHFWPPLSLVIVPLYALWSAYFLERVLKKYK